MNLYGADHHLLVVGDTIEADSHKHSFVQVTLSLGLAYEIEIGGECFRCSGIAIDSNVVHRLNGLGQPLLLLLMDSTSDLAACFKRRIGGHSLYVFPEEMLDTTSEFARGNYQAIGDSASYTSFLLQLLRLLGVDYIQRTVKDRRIAEVIHLLKECDSSEHSVGAFSEQVNLSDSRLSHLFKENTGISLSGYLTLHKLQKAIYLIFAGRSITDAALTAGFDSPSHFAATGKKLLGMTAKEIRKDSVFLKVACSL
ncbi:helix-turn-helix domain-containing protein [Cohnella boryungensis]|uniref:Helix-turn-helix domain-containing protein n=1 Tax=Cohnella boryungensis TaxID=768479 RepID=A0ABV8SJV6_9BACL